MNNKFRNRLLSLVFMLVFSVGLAFAQTTTVKHIVDRGETLQSIAKRYATTEAKIIEFNPDAAQFLYVGMELTIPVEPVENDSIENDSGRSQDNIELIRNTNQNLPNANNGNLTFERWNAINNVAYGLMPKTKAEGISGSSFALFMSFGANFNISNSVYIGARLGVSNISCKIVNYSLEDPLSINSSSWGILIPVEVGYNFHLIERKFMLTPYAGIDFNYVIKNTLEKGWGKDKDKESIVPDKRFDAYGRIGLRLTIHQFYVGGSYLYSFNDSFDNSNGIPEISIGYIF